MPVLLCRRAGIRLARARLAEKGSCEIFRWRKALLPNSSTSADFALGMGFRRGMAMRVSRRALMASMLGWGLVGERQALALSGEPFPVFESDVQEVPFKYRRRTIDYDTNEPPGTLVVHTGQRFLYHVPGNGEAIRYGVGVGKAGRTWYGEAVIGRKEKWPVWVPTPEHLAEFPQMAKFIRG